MDDMKALTTNNTELVKMANWLDTARELILSASIEDAEDLLEKARLIRILMKAMKGAQMLRAKAIKLELLCLRRLAVLGHTPRGIHGSTVVELAKVSDAEFEDILTWADSTEFAPSTIVRRWGYARDSKAARERGDIADADILRRRQYGQPPHTDLVNHPQEHIEHTAHQVLADLSRDEDEFTTDDAAEMLADELQVNWEDSVTRQGLREIIREAIMREHHEPTVTLIPSGGGEGSGLSIPSLITFKTDEWVRIPWRCAELDQLEFMADYRRHQAKEIAATADKLEDLFRFLTALGCDHKGLPQILEYAVDVGRATVHTK